MTNNNSNFNGNNKQFKGYLVGFQDSWGNDRATQIIGYYTTWKKAVNSARIVEAENVFRYQKMRKVFIVELEANKNYPIVNQVNWIQNYKNFDVFTDTSSHGFTVRDNITGRYCDVLF